MRKLKLPGGGTFDLKTPDELGGALSTTSSGRTAAYVIGAVGGAVTGVLLIYVTTKLVGAIERR